MECDKSFPTIKIRDVHIKDVHTQNVKCDCCDKIFSKKSNLTVHLKNQEAKPVRIEQPNEQHCDQCGKVFNSKSALRVHTYNLHKGIAKFDKMWERYKVLDLERDSHGTQLLQCVVDFNSKNL